MKLLRKLRNILERYARNSIFSGLIYKNKPVILTDKYGMRFVIYPYAHEPLEKLISRRYLVGEYRAISKILKEGDVVIDIGANIGTHSVYMSKIVGNMGKIYAFEPVLDTSWELRENLALNRVDNVHVVNAAIKDGDGVEKINIFPKDFSAWNSFGKPDTQESTPISSEMVTTYKLDTFVNKENINHIDFLKIDAEGSEKDILLGSKDTLSSGKIDVLSFEVSKIPMKGMGVSTKDIFDILKSFDYKIYEFDSRKNIFIGPIDDSNVEYENYYASRRDLTKI